MELLILRNILLFFILSIQSYGAMPEHKINTFNKLPEGSYLIITLSLEDRVSILFGSIEKDFLNDNYIRCFDAEQGFWRLIYAYDTEVVDYVVLGHDV